MAEPILVPLTPSQLVQFRQLAEAKHSLDQRANALAEMVVLGHYTTEEITGLTLVVTDKGITFTPKE